MSYYRHHWGLGVVIEQREDRAQLERTESRSDDGVRAIRRKFVCNKLDREQIERSILLSYTLTLGQV